VCVCVFKEFHVYKELKFHK